LGVLAKQLNSRIWALFPQGLKGSLAARVARQNLAGAGAKVAGW